MEPAFTIPTTNLIFQLISVAIIIVGPLVAAWIAVRHLSAGWRIFWLGALVFIVSQVVLRIPIMTALQAMVAPQLAASPALYIGFGLFLAFTAALFETGGRYLGYRFLLRNAPKTWDTGVIFGLGHGGIESTVLIGALAIMQLVALLTTTEASLSTMAPLQAEGLRSLAAGITDAPAWIGLRGAYERVMAVTFHVAMSVLVLQSFIRNEQRWSWYALGLHTLIDFVNPMVIPALVPDGTARLIAETISLTIFGIVALVLIIRLRRPSLVTTAHGRTRLNAS
ncbi:MAG: YhfC family intramembrane metalloprotease [Oscillochloris sp.]|nr:YhfC family intramembrane metalloprotease [Oscillochloris sp.]